MRVALCGVRGSTPTPGPAFARYGGNTSCVALAHDGQVPTLVLDAGTGLARLGDHLDGQPFRGAILLGHLHWDHTHGLPFFPTGDRPGSRITLRLPTDEDPTTVLRRVMSPPHFPIGPDELRGSWTFEAIGEGSSEAEGFDVIARQIPHKGGKTLGYRVSDGTATIAYLSDHCPTAMGPGPDGLGERHAAALELADGVDLLIHDSQYTAAELPEKAAYGHASAEYAVALATEAGARSVLLFHHDPWRTDDALDALGAKLASNGSQPSVRLAIEGEVISLP